MFSYLFSTQIGIAIGQSNPTRTPGDIAQRHPDQIVHPGCDAAAKYDAHVKCAAEANMAKLLCSEASWAAANAALDTHGGFGFAVEYDIERKFRETRLYQVAPINNNLVLAYVGQHVLGLPKSY